MKLVQSTDDFRVDLLIFLFYANAFIVLWALSRLVNPW